MTQVWARALAAGVGDEVFWGSTPVEVQTLVRAYQDAETQRQRAANDRAGVIAAEVHNSAPFGKRRRAKRPSDYFVYPGEGPDSPPALRSALLLWAESTPGVRIA